ASPSACACARYRTCPTCKRSNTPFVKTSRLPSARRRSRSRSICSGLKIFSIISQRLQDLTDVCIIATFMSIPFIEDNDQTQARREHLEALRALVGNVYPNKFERSRIVDAEKEDTISSVVEKFRRFEPEQSAEGRPSAEVLEQANAELNTFVVRLAGRIASPPRVMGKAAFVHLSDGISRLQIYIRKADVTGVHNGPEGGDVDGWALFQALDHGD